MLPVDLPPMADANDEDEKSVSIDLVDHAIVADTNSPQAGVLALQRLADLRLLGEAIDRGDDSDAVGLRDPRERFLRAVLNLGRVGHAVLQPNRSEDHFRPPGAGHR